MNNEKFVELCIKIFAHCEMDWRVTLMGNGTNAGEASNVAHEILKILDLKYDDIREDVDIKVEELRKLYG